MRENGLLMCFVVGSYTMLLVLYIFAFIERSERPARSMNSARGLSRSKKLVLVVLGIIGGLTLAGLIGDLRSMHGLLMVAMFVGGVLGITVSKVLVGRPKSRGTRKE